MTTTYIITGISKGLGKALGEKAMQPGNQLIGLARTTSEEWIQKGEQSGVRCAFYPCDLSQTVSMDAVTTQIDQAHDLEASDRVVLINNAGMVGPVAHIGEAPSDKLEQNIQLNLIAPMRLTNWFLKRLSTYQGQKQIVNISSGAANTPYDGWAAYCSSKAGLDMFTKSVALEQDQTANPAHILSFSPGVMDTDMQGEIRSADQNQFSHVETFREFKEVGKLRSTDLVAERLLDLIETGFESGRTYTIQELLT